jgi:hypothetical protein
VAFFNGRAFHWCTALAVVPVHAQRVTTHTATLQHDHDTQVVHN